ncbi:AMP phosphorylase [Candidatus Woesearchaeota archaeon]|nr:AMP phosphorylase [Candidatus Woesearchaeota archaeon]
MRFVVKDMDIATGGTNIVIINMKDAEQLDLHHMDRVVVKKGRKEAIAAVNIGESRKAVSPGKIGLTEEVLAAVDAKHKDLVTLFFAEKPKSLSYIHKKMSGRELSAAEMDSIISDASTNKLTSVELTSFIVSIYVKGLSDKEVFHMSKALAESGQTISFRHKPIVDFHCIGGVPGNRTTMIVTPILVAAGLKNPKTSSRAITSPAGTADTMEVLCPVALSAQKLKKLVNEVGGVIAWGGGVNLAPADDKMIRIEHPLEINAEGQMLASIMAKKYNVGATHLLIDIPVGKEAKVRTREDANRLGTKFKKLGKELGIKVKTIITDGEEPVGNGIGPVLEAKDCLYILKNDPRGPQDLLRRSLKMAAQILEFVKAVPHGKGAGTARRLLKSGAAYGAMVRIIEAQGGKEVLPDNLPTAAYIHDIKASKAGKLIDMDNKGISKLARLAGAPVDKEAGIYLRKHAGDSVKKGSVIMTVHARSKRKLKYALEYYKSYPGCVKIK